MAANNSPLGFGMIATFCTAILPFPNGLNAPTMRAVTMVQPTFGFATDPKTNAQLPSTASGRTLLLADVIRRISTSRGSLPDVNIPTTLGNCGIEILDYVNADMTKTQMGVFASSIDGQTKQDERLANSRSSVVIVGNLAMVTIDLVDGRGPFRLIMAISTLTGNLQVLS